MLIKNPGLNHELKLCALVNPWPDCNYEHNNYVPRRLYSSCFQARKKSDTIIYNYSFVHEACLMTIKF